MSNIKNCLLCKNYKTHPCECVHCEDYDNFRISEDGKALREKIYGDGYQDGHRDGYDKGYDDAQANSRQQGEWKVKQCLDSEGDIAGYDVCCSECGKVLFHMMNRFSTVEEAKKNMKVENFTSFCPDCGASMRKISKE